MSSPIVSGVMCLYAVTETTQPRRGAFAAATAAAGAGGSATSSPKSAWGSEAASLPEVHAKDVSRCRMLLGDDTPGRYLCSLSPHSVMRGCGFSVAGWPMPRVQQDVGSA
mmetsp:Transcript_71082/g.203711  ORF Transcript_71082/g.203711 Transcript_71082/m.203711 type:complete len:110 (-) Transcript_71082:85-414(-)